MNVKQEVILETQHINVDILFVFRVNRLFALIYLNGNNDVKRFNAQKYYLPKGIIKTYNIIINGKTFVTKQLIQI